MFPPMKRARALLFAESVPELALSEVEIAEAAWLIDVVSGRILAANGAGADVLGLKAGRAPLPLDASMPGLARLRALAAEPGRRDMTESERLLLWGRDGAVRPLCRIRFFGGGSSTLAAIVALAEADTAHRPQAPALPSVSPPSLSPSVHASLAHELKTPIGAIAAAAEIMKDERFGPLGTARYVGYAADIHGSAQHMLVVIDRMLGGDAGAQGGGAQHDLDFSEIDVADALRTTVSQLAPLAEQAGIMLSLHLPPRLPRVIADATSLKQIVLNLATNALKFTPRGGQVTVGARYSGEGPLTIAVSDTGPGIEEGEIERLLEPSGQPRAERHVARSADGGLGLGLPLARALAATNGAELVLESVPGKGTSARIVFSKDRVIPV